MVRYKRLFEENDCTLDQDKDNCSLSAIHLLTNTPYEKVKKIAGNWFDSGMPIMQAEMLLTNLGLKFVAIRNDLVNKSIKQVEATLQKEKSNSKFLATINMRGSLHDIPFIDGKFMNTFGLVRNKVKYISEWK